MEERDHRCMRVLSPIVELSRVIPGREIRILAVGQLPDARRLLYRKSLRSFLSLLDEKVWPFENPRMIQSHMVGHEIQNQLQSARSEPPPKVFQPRLPAQHFGDLVCGNGI